MVIEYANQTISSRQCEARLAELEYRKLLVRLHEARMKSAILKDNMLAASHSEGLHTELVDAERQVQILTQTRIVQQQLVDQKQEAFYQSSRDLCHWRCHLDSMTDSQLLPNWDALVRSSIATPPFTIDSKRRRGSAGVVKHTSGVLFWCKYHGCTILTYFLEVSWVCCNRASVARLLGSSPPT